MPQWRGRQVEQKPPRDVLSPGDDFLKKNQTKSELVALVKELSIFMAG
jgi:hypothetical protein